jgi:hypothetical protein
MLSQGDRAIVILTAPFVAGLRLELGIDLSGFPLLFQIAALGAG